MADWKRCSTKSLERAQETVKVDYELYHDTRVMIVVDM